MVRDHKVIVAFVLSLMSLSRNAVSFKTALIRPSGEFLCHQAREKEARLVDDLDIAREVQQQLLPKGTRAFPGLDLAAACVPAPELGGDFYDFFPFGSGRLALALGDVSGKGTAAVLLGALTIGVLREHTVDHGEMPAEVLATLNVRINAARLNARFVAMLFAVLDSKAQQLIIANAGNPYPLLVRNGRIEEIRCREFRWASWRGLDTNGCRSMSRPVTPLFSFQTASWNAKVARKRASALGDSPRS